MSKKKSDTKINADSASCQVDTVLGNRTCSLEEAEIIKGIAAYEHRQRVILRILGKHKELTEIEFDRIFTEYKYIKKDNKVYPKMRRMRLEPITGDTFILGSLTQGEYGKWLHLTQLMMAAGLINAETKNGMVIYSVA